MSGVATAAHSPMGRREVKWSFKVSTHGEAEARAQAKPSGWTGRTP